MAVVPPSSPRISETDIDPDLDFDLNQMFCDFDDIPSFMFLSHLSLAKYLIIKSTRRFHVRNIIASR